MTDQPTTAPFQKVLVANRSEIALRVLRCLRELNIASAIIYHDADRDSPAVAQADEAFEITGENPTAGYLDIEQIVGLCTTNSIDAVHPGYGFLAENAGFARALQAANITFIGPATEAMELMGDKIRSREFVEQHGFPVPPSVSMDADNPGFKAAVAAMKLPLVVKASAGGGGKGMSIVHSLDELENTLKIAASEASKYFGDKRVYVERYFENARHIEVQLLGDGNSVVHLGERECSVQRRFQKIIEESPSPVLSDEKRQAICEAAAGIAAAANYSNAGTVEFLYTLEGEFFFLEMNTRIQVEHPVTEMVTGIDLVAEQIHIAAGQPLRMKQSDIQFNGHAIECRLCAEDAYNGFTPETGKVLFLKEPEGARFDSGLYPNQAVTTAFDPMLAKLIVHAPTREQATGKAVAALRDLVLLGVKTNADYLTTVLQHPAFAEAAMDTGFLQAHSNELTEPPIALEDKQALLAAALLSDRAIRTMMEKTPQPHAAIGDWRN